MNRRGFIIGGIIAVIIIAGLVWLADFLSYRTIAVVFKQPEVAVKVFTNDTNREVTSLTEDKEIRLKDGEYYYVTSGEKFGEQRIHFKVQGVATLEISPSYSKEYLSTLLERDQGVIRGTLYNTYPQLSTGYSIGDEALHRYGEWYSAKIIKHTEGAQEPDVYRVILRKSEGGGWIVVANPQLIISIQTTPGVPEDVIRQVNEPLSNEAYGLLYQ